MNKQLYFISKRIFDFLFSLLGLLILSPVLLICAILAKCQSSGPVFYKSKRVGQHEELFLMYKFRTMVVNADAIGGSLTTYADPRVTTIGGFLRLTKLDELPQLINVLKGDMSVIGPRPETSDHIEYYTPEQRQVLSIKPGIAGMTQLEYRDEEQKLKGQSDPDAYYINVLMPEKLKIDLNYLAKQSLFLDLKLFLKTILAVIYRSNK